MSPEIITYTLMLLYFFLFFIAVHASSQCESGELKDILTGNGEAGVLLNRLIAGIFFLGTGAIYLIIRRDLDTEIFMPLQGKSYLQPWLLIAMMAVLTGTFSAMKKITPHTSIATPLPSSLPLSFVFIRTLYLIVYEFFFRGMMLFVMMGDFGTIAAVIINILLYVLIHWFNKAERVGSVPMGLILCWVTIYYHSVWPAVFIHVALALSHEFTLFFRYYLLTKKQEL